MLECSKKLAIFGFLLVAYLVVAQDTELRLVTVLFRHGDRTPRIEEVFPTDPNFNSSFYPEGYGELTNQGKNRAYRLGQYLRNRYNPFLGPVYTSDILYARSTDVDRAKMSMQLVLAGLFPPASIQQWDKNLIWQPIPYQFNHVNSDSLLLGKNCPKHKEELQTVLKSSKFLNELEQEYGTLMKYLSNVTGSKISFPYQISDVYQGLVTESHMNLRLPDWAHAIFSKRPLLHGTLFYFETDSYNDKLKRLNGGPLLRKISENIMAVTNGTLEKGRKIFLYSAHEITIAALLKALEIPISEVPYFSSAIIIELRKDEDNDYFVQLSYRAENRARIKKLQLPGCDHLCPLETFLDLTKNVWPSDEELICRPPM